MTLATSILAGLLAALLSVGLWLAGEPVATIHPAPERTQP